jgi:hypothetical protein
MRASDFATLIPEFCSEVIDSMFFAAVNGSGPRAAMPVSLLDGPPFLAFGLRFTGDVSGRFGVHLEESVARTLSANFLGQEESEISAIELSEVVGELANMLCGSVVSRIEEKSKFVLSHPEACCLPMISADDDFLVYGLETDGGVITVWIFLEGQACL